MADQLIRAAVIVLGERNGVEIQALEQKKALGKEVSCFLLSLGSFPCEPLPFPLDVYRAFFVLVAQWRDGEFGYSVAGWKTADADLLAYVIQAGPSIDACHTVDAARGWLEAATEDERYSLDRELVGDVWFWGGPCDWTCKLLDMIAALHAGEDVRGAVKTVANRLVESLEAASASASPLEEARPTVLAILGICVDALAEIDWEEATDEAPLSLRFAQLLTGVLWPSQEDEFKIVAGILERLQARDSMFSFNTAGHMAATIVDKLGRELRCSRESALDGEAEQFATGIDMVFGLCLQVMVSIDTEDAVQAIRFDLLEPLLALLKPVLEFTADTNSDDQVIQLDSLATRLFDRCSQVVDEAYLLDD